MRLIALDLVNEKKFPRQWEYFTYRKKALKQVLRKPFLRTLRTIIVSLMEC